MVRTFSEDGFAVGQLLFRLAGIFSQNVAVRMIAGEVAGQCDILLVPTVEAGNILVKTFSFLGGGRTAGVVLGAQAPVVLTSRADSAESRVHSVALGVMMHNMQRTSRLKIGRVHF